ncbi:MAG: lasso peptide biosynthesis B2 protein [Vicinamibacterales bacterium]
MTRTPQIARVRDAAKRLTACVRADARLTASMVISRVSLPLLKHAINVRTLAGLMWSPPVAPFDGDRSRQEVERIRQFATIGGRLLVSTNCLDRSLTLYRLLSRAGAKPVLLLGARKTSDATDGHAWIELDGQPFPGPDGEEYAPIVGFGARGSPCPVT